MLDSIRQDLIFALRSLRHTPAFTAAAILTLGLGIGANTAIFSVVYGVLAKPLEYHEPDRLMAVQRRDTAGPSLGLLNELRQQATSFESMAGHWPYGANVSGPGGPQRLQGLRVAGPLFEVLGVPVGAGRGMAQRDNEAAAPLTVVLSHRAATQLLDPSRDSIGQKLTLNDNSATVIGIMPRGFRFPDEATDFWLPARFDDPADWGHGLDILARLSADRSKADAMSELATLLPRYNQLHPRAPRKVRLTSFLEGKVGPVRGRLLVLAGCVGMILLIACANVGNLLLARADHRRNEMTVRRALGAGRGRLVRQLVTESLLLSFLGGVAGLLLGAALLRLIVRLLPADMPRLETIAIDTPVLLFTFVATVATSLLAGTLPAWVTSNSALRDGRGSSRSLLRQTLIIAQVALAVTLLTGAGMLLRSFAELLDVDPGIRTANRLSFRVTVPNSGFGPAEERLAVFQRLDQRLQALPGAGAMARTTFLPINGTRGYGTYFTTDGGPQPSPVVMYRAVSSNYLEVVGGRLLAGRLLEPADYDSQREVGVVNESLARTLWPDGNAIGRVFELGFPEEPFMATATVVGVVADARDLALDQATEPLVYVPDHAVPFYWSYVYVMHSEMEPAALASSVRQALLDFAPDLPMYQIRTLESLVDDSLVSHRSAAALLSAFAFVALGLAAVGMFGVCSYLVTRRRREIAIRMALGAGVGQLRLMLLGQGLRLAALGLVLGLIGAWGIGKVISNHLYLADTEDPVVWLASAFLLVLVMALASDIPARRAAQIQPATALHED